MPFDATPVTSPVIDLLEKVHAAIKQGWTQNESHNYETDSYCLIGAVYHLADRDAPHRKLIDPAVHALGFQFEDQVVSWNDADTRTKQGVLRKVTAAIKRERKKLLLGG